MARRALAQPLRDKPVFDAPQKVKDYLALHLGQRLQEVFAVLLSAGRIGEWMLQSLRSATFGSALRNRSSATAFAAS
jgi:DNA repair protein RadC